MRVEVGGEGVAEGRPGGDGESAQGQAVVGRREGEDARSAGRGEGGLERDLDRLGAGDGEEDLRVRALRDRRQGGEALGELDAARVSGDVAQAV